MGTKQLIENAKPIIDLAKGLFTLPERTPNEEAFEAALERLELTEADLQQRAKAFNRLRFFYLLVAACVFSYGIYLLNFYTLRGALASFGVTFIPLGFAFRYHFWLYQVRQRKLGCTFREVMNATFLGNKK